MASGYVIHNKTVFPKRYLKKETYKSGYALYKGRELILHACRIEIFLIKEKEGKGLKLLTPKQIIQRISISLAKLNARNTFENLLNEIRKIMHSLHREKEITKKLYSNTIDSIKV